MDISRRGFLGGAVSAAGCAACAAQSAVSQDVVVEPTRSIAVRGSYDIIVAGGGPAGIAAAVAAARTGAKTLLIEAHGCLGGIWTSGLVGCVLDFDKGGLADEIIRRLDALGARKRNDSRNFHYEPEYMKFVCEELCREAGVAVRLMTFVVAAATLSARREIVRQISALAALGGPWKGVRVAATAEQIGIRSARRIHGRYMLTREDLINGARFGDAVCESRYPADIHALDAKSGRSHPADTTSIRWKPFQIPLRSLRARDVDNLWMAGRCISGDAIAHASYRVTGSAVATGTTAGRAAVSALTLKTSV